MLLDMLDGIRGNTEQVQDLFSSFHLRPKLEGPDQALTQGISNLTLQVELLEQQLSCEKLSDVYMMLKGAACCDMLSALTFFWVSWVLIGICMCPGSLAGIKGYKRLSDELWGPLLWGEVLGTKKMA